MKLTIAKKLIMGFMSLVVLMLVISVVSYYNLQKVAESADIILDDQVPLADVSMEAIIALVKTQDLMGEYLLCNDIKKLDELRKEYDEYITDYDMFINAIIYGSESREFESAEGGKVHQMWIKDGFDNTMVVKRGSDEMVQHAREAEGLHDKFMENAEEMMMHHKKALQQQEVVLNEEEKEAREHMVELDKFGALATKKMEEVEIDAGKSMDAAMEMGDNAVAQANILIIVISLISIITGIVIGFMMSRAISIPILSCSKAAEAIAKGDLESEDVVVKSRDEIGILAESFAAMKDSLKYKQGIIEQIAEGAGDFTIEVELASEKDTFGKFIQRMLGSLNEVLSQVSASSEQVTSGSAQVSSASQSLSQGASEQASSLEEITSSITEINSQAKQNADNASEANAIAKQSMDNAQNGDNQMKELVSAMTGINESAEGIKKIVKVIDDIAFQINLLALNANVEAARAGKYGKGFAVVAEEVRNLAGRSATSVQETTQMVEDAIKNVEGGNQLVETTAAQLAEIVNAASKVTNLVEEIAVASKEQAQGLEQINVGLGQVDQVTQSNTSSAEECASASEELASQSQQLMAMVGKFKLAEGNGNAEIGEAGISSDMMQRLISTEMAKQKVHQDHAAGIGKIAMTVKDQGDQYTPNIDNGGDGNAEKKTSVNPEDVIKLDDTDFGKF